jgi:HK97 family phage prohead protease
MDKEIRYLNVEDLSIRAEGDETPKLEGYAAVFDSWSEDLGGFREKICPGAFTRSLGDAERDVFLLADHTPTTTNVLARRSNGSLQITEDERGLKFSATLPDTQMARDIRTNIEAGNINSMSFGFRVADGGDSWTERDSGDIERTLEDVDLFEVSVVAMPAYPSTTVSARALDKVTELRKEKDSHKPTPLSAESAKLRRKAFLISRKIKTK